MLLFSISSVSSLSAAKNAPNLTMGGIKIFPGYMGIYDFTSQFEGKNMFGKKCDPSFGSNVPLNAPIPKCNGALEDITFNSGLDFSDNQYVTNLDNNVDTWQVFYADLSNLSAGREVLKLNWTWEGGKTFGTGDIKLLVWNVETNSWEEKYLITGFSTADVTRNLVLQNPKKYITSDKKTYLMMFYDHSGGYQLPRTDFVSLKVNYGWELEAIPYPTELPSPA